MLALVYPGQGSQHPGMGRFLFDEFALAREVFEEASDAISVDLKKLCFNGSESDLALTEVTQPSLLTVSTATHRVINSLFPIKAVAAAGHSVGEYAAAVNFGTLNLGRAVLAVRTRGQAMQNAVPVGIGAMAAILGLEDQMVKDLCHWVTQLKSHGVLEPANFNTPGQIVVSGHKTAVDYLQTNFANSGIAGLPSRLKLIPLKVSAPFHCSLMAPAEQTMSEFLNDTEFHDATVPIVQNVTAEPTQSAGTIRDNLIRQVSAPVRWVECIHSLKKMGVNQLIEVGCGKVLNGLVKKIDSEGMTTLNINSLDDLKVLETVLKV